MNGFKTAISKTMDFSEALLLMKQGKVVKTKNGKVKFFLSQDKKKRMLFSTEKEHGMVTKLGVEYILADDWEEVTE